jgi:hypothetical protein
MTDLVSKAERPYGCRSPEVFAGTDCLPNTNNRCTWCGRLKIHFAPVDADRTLCGRSVYYAAVREVTVRVTTDPHVVTCIRCKSSPYLDEYLANWNA